MITLRGAGQPGLSAAVVRIGRVSQRRRPPRERADWVARGQFGVISRAQALDCGLALGSVQHRLRPGGQWTLMLPGVYRTDTGAPAMEQLLMGAVLYAGEGSLITGLAALRYYRVRAAPPAVIDVLIPASRRRASRQFVVVHRVQAMPRQGAARGPVRFTAPARAAADAARGLTRLADVRAVGAAVVQQGRCTVPDLTAELNGGPRRHSGLLRIALDEVADGVRSPAEADLRTLVRRTGLPAPLYNARLYLGGRLLAVPDAWWPEAGVVAEVDSRAWHLSPAEWEQTMRRHAALTAAGLLVLHFSPRQLRNAPGALVSAIRGALAVGRPAPGVTVRRDRPA
jgi:very-short-patch-repair endonuclease